MGHRVIQLSASDLDDLVELESQCFAYHWTREQFLMGLQKGVFKILGIRDASRLVGY